MIVIDGEVGNTRTSWNERKATGELDGQLIVSTTEMGSCVSTVTWEDVCALVDILHPSLLLLSIWSISHHRRVRACLFRYAQSTGCQVLSAGCPEVQEGSLDQVWGVMLKSHTRDMNIFEAISTITYALCSLSTYEEDIFFVSSHSSTWICASTVFSKEVL